MEIFFPAQTLSLFQVFAPCFTAPSFAYFRAYVWALMVVEGRKCMTRLARCAFFHPRDLISWERWLAEHRHPLINGSSTAPPLQEPPTAFSGLTRSRPAMQEATQWWPATPPVR